MEIQIQSQEKKIDELLTKIEEKNAEISITRRKMIEI